MVKMVINMQNGAYAPHKGMSYKLTAGRKVIAYFANQEHAQSGMAALASAKIAGIKMGRIRLSKI